MFKKVIASVVMLTMMFGVSLTSNAQDSKDYKMWESIMLTPDYTNLKTLGENMRKHNETYHKTTPYEANVYNISSGPNSGKIIWEMGPMMLKHNDTRPGEGGHNADWRDNVMPYIKEMHTIEYWRKDDKLSNTGSLTDNNSDHPIMFVRYFEVEADHGYTMNSIFKQVSATLKSMPGDNPWGLYYNAFLQGDLGRHVAAVSFYKSWADFDEDIKFKDAYEKLYGENSWDNFLDTLDDTFSNRWDEIWEYNKFMSGD
ncbi:hypothetical protein [Ichthyenterobacterium magnum]|uniref:NIPSNAP protein n=1 Tax=Ichthyenterobacterium magnum TaxID=1230530 RepID=A0A420DV39_9FLAO|nr:hypothetical protein [Ichthyenterobacterium magnum]RKE98184.1 hypothetical protein BXY80_0259 [Ichthyenterobacterium magnum]